MLGTLINNYRVVRKVCEEILSVSPRVGLSVYALQHEPSKRQAVLRVLTPALPEPGGPEADSHPAALRYFAAARALYLVRDPGVLEVFDCDILPDGTPYVIHEDFSGEGELLVSRLQRFGRFPELLALLLAQQVAAALHAAHRKGVAPIGLHPARVLILPDASAPGEERAKLLLPDRDELGESLDTGTLPDPGAAPPPRPVAPEVQAGAPGGPESDVYLLGALLYQMLTGRVYDPAVDELFLRTAREAEDAARRLDAPRPDVAGLLVRMLDPGPSDRPPLSDVQPELVRLSQRPTAEMRLLHDTFGKYRVLRKLGEGGMGTVFLSVNEETGHQVAIKVLHQELAQMPQVLKRFYNEARTANHVKHPGIVGVYELGQLPDRPPFIVMEYLEGESLGARLLRLGGSLPLYDALSIGHQIAAIMSAAHERGVVHRDLKPDNVMIVRDPFVPGGERVKVLDFGIAKLMPLLERVSVQRTGTRTGAMLGTPLYMAPEQCRGSGQVTERADVYALGVMLYELLVGRAPYQGGGVSEVMAMHLYCDVPQLQHAAPGLEGDLSALVGAMLAKNATDRPPMVQVAAELKWLSQQREGQKTLIKAPILAGKVTVRGAPQPTQVPAARRREVPFEPGLRHWAGFGVVLLCLFGVLALLTASAPTPSGGGTGAAVRDGAGLLVEPARASAARNGAEPARSPEPAREPPRDAEPSRGEPARLLATLEPSSTTENLYGVWSGAGAAFAVGGGGVILRRQSGLWAADAGSRLVAQDLYAVWGNAADDVWAVGQDGTALYYDGSRWVRIPTGVSAHLNALWGSGPEDVWAVGHDVVLHWDGHAWRRHGTERHLLYSVWGFASGEVFAVGARGLILRWDGGRWQTMPSGVGVDLMGVWGTRPTDLFAVGQRGTVLHRGEDGAWRDAGSDGLRDLSLYCVGGGADGVVAAGHAEAGPALVRLDGRRARRLEVDAPRLPEGIELYAVTGREGLVLVGLSGTVLRGR